jgi:hypothetical protein
MDSMSNPYGGILELLHFVCTDSSVLALGLPFNEGIWFPASTRLRQQTCSITKLVAPASL